MNRGFITASSPSLHFLNVWWKVQHFSSPGCLRIAGPLYSVRTPCGRPLPEAGPFKIRNFAFGMECILLARPRPSGRAPLPPATKSGREGALRRSLRSAPMPALSCSRGQVFKDSAGRKSGKRQRGHRSAMSLPERGLSQKPGRGSPFLTVMPWLNMAVPISPVTVIASGVVPPILMAAFPAMKTLQPDGVTEQPDIARSQIVILVANETDVFVTIPDVTVRNHYRAGIDNRGRCRIDHWLRSHHHEWPNPHHLSIWRNDTAG